MNETIKEIPLNELHPFPDHPFGVRDDEAMEQTVESIREYGVLVPAIVRPRGEGGYELIAGHRRKHACELAGRETMPVIVRDLDRNAAIIIMVDSNLQRESILPSEKAKAYKMKLEAIKRQGKRHDLTSTQPVSKLRSNEELGQTVNESRETIRRYIRLNELEPELMQMVDEGKIGMTPAVEISYLKPEEQKLLVETIDSEQATPSFSQAQRMTRENSVVLVISLLSSFRRHRLKMAWTLPSFSSSGVNWGRLSSISAAFLIILSFKPTTQAP